MKHVTSWVLIWGICLTLLVAGSASTPSMAWAQEATATEEAAPAEAEKEAAPAAEEAAAPEAAAEEAKTEEAAAEEAEAAPTPEDQFGYTINTLIMFLCAVLVIFMQAGFAMVEVGLNSAKNTINILFKNLMDFAIGCLLYFFIGYALMYPGADYAGKWFGYSGVVGIAEPSAPTATTWSPYADFLFQVAFAATAATIVSGAVAGRMKFEAYLIYSAVISAFVYPISGMWKWGGGFLAAQGFADFAGSILVHAVGGFAGLAGAIVLGPRLGRFVAGKSIPFPGHNMTFATLGVFVLWVGWYGFNPGSLLTYAGATNADKTVYIAVTTTLAAAAGTVAALIVAWVLFKKPDLSMALNGALGGLVGITANCDQVSFNSAILIGGIAGVLVVSAIIALEKLQIDDPVGAFPVHGVCGLWGGLATGFFGTAIPEGLDRGGFVWVQTYSSLIVIAWAFSTMMVLFLTLKAIGVLRVSAEHEHEGLDISEHGSQAYPPQPVVGGGVSSKREMETVGSH